MAGIDVLLASAMPEPAEPAALFKQIEALFAAVLEQQASARTRFLEQATSGESIWSLGESPPNTRNHF